MSNYRPHSKIRQYLADYIADRALVCTDLHRDQIDRIYYDDPIVQGYTICWDHATRTPFARRGCLWLFPEPTDDHTQIDIINRYIATTCTTSISA